MNIPFRTEVRIEHPGWSFGYQTPAFFIGSCFSDHIGNKLKTLKFPVTLNPFGVLYNPVSISNALKLALHKQEISNDNLIKHENLWHSFDFHGSFSDILPEKVTEKCNNAIAEANTFLLQSDFLFITFGTAWVYRFRDNGKIVANCHKIPAAGFDRYRLNVNEIIDEWIPLLSNLYQFNPNLKTVFTISPIRHLKDGAHENQLSKSTLLLAVDEIMKHFSPDRSYYFPSYELMMDELRDYRFYDNDMIHISETGIQFIFEKFKETFFSVQSLEIVNLVQPVIQAKQHKLLTKDIQSIKKFSDLMLHKVKKLMADYPYINFQNEIQYFKNLGESE